MANNPKKREYGTWHLKPIRGRRYLLANGNTINKEIFYDVKAPGPLLPFEPLIPEFQKVFTFELTFDEIVTEEEANRMGIKPFKTFNKEMSVKDPGGVTNPTSQSMCLIRRVVKDAYFLFNNEVHPLLLNNIITKDKGQVEFVILYRTRIKSAWEVMTEYPDGKFLLAIQATLSEQLGSFYRSKKFDSVLSLKEKAFDAEKEELIEELNSSHFDACPFELAGFHIEEIIVDKNSQDRIDAGEEQEIAKLRGEAAKITAKATADSTVITGAATATVIKLTAAANAEKIKVEGEQKTTVFKNNLEFLYQFNLKNSAIVNATVATATDNMRQHKGALVTNGNLFGSNDSFLNQLTANLITQQTEEDGN